VPAVPIFTTWRCAAGGVFAAGCARPTVRSLASAATSAPGAPASLTSSVTGSTVQLTWTAPSGGDAASSYVVEAGSASGLIDLANFDTGNAAVTLTVTGVPAGSYFVRVRAKTSAGFGNASNEVILTVAGGACTTAPGAPTSLVATVSGTSVSLSWKTAAAGCTPTGYVLEAGSASGLSNLANFNTGFTVTSFSASGIAPGTYFVRVRAANTGGSSAASNEVTVVTSVPPCTAPSAPSGLAASVSGATVTLSWTAASGTPTSYHVEIGTASGSSNVSSTDTGSTATSASTTLSAATYFIRVKAVNACGTSSASNEATATTTSTTPAPAVITITSSGVSPTSLTVSPGTQVTFINNDQIVHDMTSNPHPEHTDCQELNQVGFLVPGQSRQTGNLNSVRTCGYHDHTNAFNTAMQGTITIR
jgi:plastocyanin